MSSSSIPIVVINTGKAEEEALLQALQNGWLGQGPQVEELERYVSGVYSGAHCVAMHSCTGALHLALLSLGVGPGDLVAVPGFTFVATANAVEYCGATPVIVDVDPRTYNMNPQQLNQVLKQARKPLKAVMLVHEFGLCAAMDAIQKIIPSGTHLLEDAACAYGSAYQGKPAGSFGDIACFSLHPRKVVTSGEGGFLITKNAEWAYQARLLRNHGLEIREGHWDMPVLGYNQRMTDLQAALGLVQLRRASEFIEKRREKAATYHRLLASVDELQLPYEHDDYTQNSQSYVVQLKPPWLDVNDLKSLERLRNCRQTVLGYLAKRDIGGRLAAYALHDVSYYKNKYNFRPLDYRGSLLSAYGTLALPIYPDLTNEQQERVVAILKEALSCLK